MKIQELYKRIFEEDVYFYTVLLLTVGMLSFALGRLSVTEPVVATTNEPGVVLSLQAAIATYGSSTEQNFVASKKGTKYHLLDCSGAQRINEENKIYFASQEEARASGYTPAVNCDF